jgi:glutathione S-transferase
VALQRLLVPFEGIEINVLEPSAEVLGINPLGTVPFLKITQGKETQVLVDSASILEYLHENHGNRIWPGDLAMRLKVRTASTFAEGVMTNTVAAYLERMRPSPSAEHIEEYEGNIRRTLQWIQNSSVAYLPWKVSDFQLTQAGYDLCIALEYLEIRAAHLNWKGDFPELAKFLELHRKRQDLAPTSPPTS